MLKKTISIAAACALALCLSAGISAASDDVMTLTTASGKKPATFPHKAHQEKLQCADCHHTQNADGTQGPYVAGEEKPCESCHNDTMANKKLNSFKNAAHANCKECHKNDPNKKAPTKCNGCHVK